MFFERDAELLIPQPLFKSAMVVISGGFGAYLLTISFKRVAPAIRSGLMISLPWLAISSILDFVFVVCLFRMPAH